MNDLQNKVITISGKEEKLQGGKPVMKIKDEKGLTYTVYKTKQDGSTSVAWTQLDGINLGDSVQIGFSETQGEYEGKAVTYRSIRSFNKDIGQGVVNKAMQEKTTNSVPNNASDDKFWERKGYEKCLWGYWLSTDRTDILQPDEMDKVWQVFKQIEKDSKKRFFIYSEPEQMTTNVEFTEEPLPEEQEIDVSDIPF